MPRNDQIKLPKLLVPLQPWNEIVFEYHSQDRRHLMMHETKIGERIRGITRVSLKGAMTFTKIFYAFNEQVDR